MGESDARSSRDLYWSGGYNIRDLGGLPTANGGCTARGAFVRSATLHRLTDGGWQALADYGIRTVIDLRNEDERQREPDVERPGHITRVNVAIDEIAGKQWYESVWHLDGTPRIFPCYLRDRPQSPAAVVKAIASADPGGILFHCAGGRDRTGLVTLVLLVLADVESAAIAADYSLSYDRQRVAWAALGMTSLLGQVDKIEQELADVGTTVAEVIQDTLDCLDIRAILVGAGVSAAELAAVTARLCPS
jgi:protein-tyrosine phosphatase